MMSREQYAGSKNYKVLSETVKGKDTIASLSYWYAITPTLAVIKEADQQFAEARHLFYKLQWQGHGWFKEFYCRTVYNFAKDIDRVVSALLSVWYWDTVERSFAQNRVLSWAFFAEIKSKHAEMIRFLLWSVL
jgi:hypothetical protein